MKSIVALVFLFFSIQVYSSENIAQVNFLRGKALQKARGVLSPRFVKKGDLLLNGTRLRTSKTGHLYLAIGVDGSFISMAAGTEIVLEKIQNTDTFFVNLIHGNVRVRSNGNENDFNIFVRTHRTVTGIKNGDTLVNYHKKSKLTSVLALSREAFFNKTQEKDDPVMVRKSRLYKINKNSVNQRRDGQIDILSVMTIDRNDKLVLTDILNNKDTTVIGPGQISFAPISLSRISLPVKISPIQYKALYENNSFLIHSGKEIIPDDITDLSIERVTIVPQEQTAPAEGFYNKITKYYAPKAGGLLDLNTALYIAPGEDAEFNSRYKVYSTLKNGTIDSKTGQYIAPIGLGLHSIRGFLPLNKKIKRNKQIMSSIPELNKSILKDTVLAKSKEKVKEVHNLYSNKKELFTKNQVLFNVRPLSYSISVTNVPVLSDKNISSSYGLQSDFSWFHSSNTTWQSITTITNKSVKMNIPDGSQISDTSTKNMWSASFGLRWFLSRYLNLLTEVIADQNLYLLYTDNTTRLVDKMVFSRFNFVLEGQWAKSDRLSFHANIGFNSTLGKTFVKDVSYTTGLAIGYRYQFGVKWWPSTKWWFMLDYFGESEKQAIFYSTDSYDHLRTNSGVGLNFSKVF